jgi:hypothetical protein
VEEKDKWEAKLAQTLHLVNEKSREKISDQVATKADDALHDLVNPVGQFNSAKTLAR